MSGAKTTRRRVVQRRIGDAESAAPKRWRQNGLPHELCTIYRLYVWIGYLKKMQIKFHFFVTTVCIKIGMGRQLYADNPYA